MNYKDFDYRKLTPAQIEVQPMTELTAANWRRVLVVHAKQGTVSIMPAHCAIDRMHADAARLADEYFCENPSHIMYAEFWPNTVYLSRSPFLITLGRSNEELLKLQLNQCAAYDIRSLRTGSLQWHSQPLADPIYAILFKPKVAADDHETPTADSTAEGSESGAGADSCELSELGITKLCTEFSELKASLTHFRNDCALICEYARTVDELANKLAAVCAVPTVARTRKPRAGKADTKTPAPSTGNSVLDAL